MAGEPDPAFSDRDEFSDARGLKARAEIQAEHRTHPRSWFRWFFEHLRFPTHFSLLELGCGTGDLWLENRERLPGSSHIVLSDFSAGMVREARRGLGGKIQCEYLVCNAQQLPFAAGQFDLVIGSGLLDLLEDPGQALGEIHRVLKPGGVFYTSAGGRAHLLELEALARPFLPEAAYGGDAERFGLENGSDIIKACFPEVGLARYTSDLVFEEEGPLLEYILSESGASHRLSGARLAGLRQSLEAIIRDSGRIQVKVEKGMFKASKQ